MTLKFICPTCKKNSGIQSEIPFSGRAMLILACGHTLLKPLNLDTSLIPDDENGSQVSKEPVLESQSNSQELVTQPDKSFESLDGSKLAYEFQQDGIKFAEKSGFNCLIADEMGLGKTIQALLTIKRNKKTLCPVLIVVKSSLIFQWAKELKTWASEHPFGVMPILGRNHIIPGFGAYIISMDLLSRKGVLEKLLTLNIKCIILDEVHSFKDPSSNRTKALINFITQAKICYKIALSGTPIKNRADEYFTILNLLAPEYFYSLSSFRRNWLITNEKGQYTRISPWRIDEFKRLTEKWIIRREKKEVMKHLPPLTRDYKYIEITDPAVKASYNKTLDLFDNFLNNTANITSVDLLGWLARLRAITGSAKCEPALDYITEFLDSCDDSLAIGIQHKDVRDTLYHVLSVCGYDVLKLSGEDSPYAKERIVNQFNRGDSRVMVINMIAGGVGLNLQSCSNALVLERQWSSSDEEQFEGRFHRDGQLNPVTVTYLIAANTIDDFFHEMVERKRKIVDETLGKWDLSNDDNALNELSRKVVSHRL